MEDNDKYYGIYIRRGVVTLYVGWRDEKGYEYQARLVFSVRELASMNRQQQHEVITYQAQKQEVPTSIPLHVEAALLVLALGEPPQ